MFECRFILIGISLAATGGYMLNVIGKYDIPGAPAKTAMYCLIGLGVLDPCATSGNARVCNA